MIRYVQPVIILIMLSMTIPAGAGKIPKGPYEPAKYPGVEQTAEILGVNITFIDEGQGDPILFIHGLTGNIGDWDGNIPYFAANHRVLAFDLPGHGKSEKRCDLPYGRDFFTKVTAEFMKARGVDSAVLVSNSMGGMVAASVAIAHPEMVKKLVLSDAVGIKFMPWPVRKFAGIITPGMVHTVWANRIGVTKTEATSFAHPENYPREQLIFRLGIVTGPDSKSYSCAVARCIRDIMKQDMSGELDRIKCPTLIVWGEKDTLVPIKCSKIWLNGISGSKLVVIPDAGHACMMERPMAFNKAMEEFIAQ